MNEIQTTETEEKDCPETGKKDSQMSVFDLKRRAMMVSQIKSEIMRENVHWGKIPGCGDKPTLLKNGAELLCMAFGLASAISVEVHDLGSGHREYTVTTTLSEIQTGRAVASGVGSCSTMESKYRYRGNEMESTGTSVPRDYWTAKKNNPGEAQKMLGGKNFRAKKDADGNWIIYRAGDKKLENPDIADVYNTVLKMAAKRSFVDATLKATGGSCEFTQDAEDVPFQNCAQSSIPDAEIINTIHPESCPQAAAPEMTEAKKREAFFSKMEEYRQINPDAYFMKMGEIGFEGADDVPASQMHAVMVCVKNAVIRK